MLLSPIGSQEKPTQSPAEMLTSSKLHGLDVHQKECYHPGKMDQGMTTAQDLTFGELVRRHRRDRGLTQEELAEQATLSVRAISDLERGLKYRPRKDTVQLLARALGLSPEDGKAFERAARRGIDPGDSARHRDLPMGTYFGAAPQGMLIGRDSELTHLMSALDAAVNGTGQVVLLAGEPGIGKTRLGQAVALHARVRGWQVAAGSSYESRQSVPYYPFLDVLSSLVDAAPPDTRAAVFGHWPQLDMLLLDHHIEGADWSNSGPLSQEMLFRAVGALLQELAERMPLAILLDDLHWADQSSLDLLQHLARHTRRHRVFVLGTYRPVEVSPQHPLHQALRVLRREHLAERMAIGPLGEGETAAQLAAILGDETIPTELAVLIHRYTEGNPFFTEEVLQALVKRGDVYREGNGWSWRETSGIEVPESVREAIGERLSRLPEGAQDLLRQASVLGQTFAFDQLQAMDHRAEQDVESALEAAAGAGLIRETGLDQFGFNHALTQHALYTELPGRRRRKLHLAAGLALERLPDAERQEKSAELAWHFLAGDDAARALPYALLAGEQAEAVFGHREAEQQFHTSVELAREVADVALERKALERLGYVLGTMNRNAEAIDALEAAAFLARASGDLDAEIRIVSNIGWVHRHQGTIIEGTARVRSLLSEVGEMDSPPSLGYLWVILCMLLFLQPEVSDAEAMEAAERAAAIARAANDDRLLAQAEGRRALLLNAQGKLEEGRAALLQAIPLARETGDLLTLLLALNNLAVSYGLTRELEAAGENQERALQVALQLGNPIMINYMGWVISYQTFISGDWPKARADAERVASVLQGMGAHRANLVASLALFDLHEGKSREASRHLDEAINLATGDTEPENLHWLEYVRAVHDHWAGGLEACIDRLERVRRDARLTVNIAPFVYVALGEAYLAHGKFELARDMAAAALKYSCRAYRWSDIQALRLQIRIGGYQRRWEEAQRVFEEALAESRAATLPFYEAQILYDYGVTLSSQGMHAQAGECLTEALTIFRRIGAVPFVERSRQALQHTGERALQGS